MKKLLTLSLLLSAFALHAQTKTYNTMYLCMDCNDPSVENTSDSFYEGYEQLGVNKKNILGVGSSMMSVSADSKVKEDIQKLEYFKKHKIPYQKYEKGRYEILKSHMGDGGASKANIKANLLKYLKQMDKTKPIVIHIGGHGYNGGMAGEGKEPPEKAGIAMFEPGQLDRPQDTVLSHEELSQLMKEAGLIGPGAPAVRIVAEHCYGGGVHWLSEKIPNVCSASFSDYKHTHLVLEKLPKKFWGNYNQLTEMGTKPSLADTFNSVYGDRGRNTTASLGSTAYVRQLLAKKGLKAQTADGYDDWDVLLNDVDYANQNCGPVADPVLENQQGLSELMNDVSQIYSSTANPFLEGLKDLKANEGYYRKLLKEYQAHVRDVKMKWHNLDEKQQLNQQREWNSSASDFGTWITGGLGDDVEAQDKALAQRKALTQKEFEAYRQKTLPKIVKYLEEKDKARMLKEVSQFDKLYQTGKVSEEEMQNYKRMLKCEAMPL